MRTASYNCPSCGGPLAFGGASSTLECAACGSTFEPEALEILNSSESSEQIAFELSLIHICTLYLPASLETIGDGAFKGNLLLQYVIVDSPTPPTLGEGVFAGCDYLYDLSLIHISQVRAGEAADDPIVATLAPGIFLKGWRRLEGGAIFVRLGVGENNLTGCIKEYTWADNGAHCPVGYPVYQQAGTLVERLGYTAAGREIVRRDGEIELPAHWTAQGAVALEEQGRYFVYPEPMNGEISDAEIIRLDVYKRQDLTGGRVAGLTAFVAAILLQRAGANGRFIPDGVPQNLLLVLLLVMVIGACIGLINGFIMAKWKLHPYIITLAMQMITYGIYLTVSNSKQVSSLDTSLSLIHILCSQKG